MHLTAFLLPALLGGALATENPHKRAATLKSRAPKSASKSAAPVKRALSEDSQFLNSNSEKFVVNGTGVPEVNFDLGESYAGHLPITSPNIWVGPDEGDPVQDFTIAVAEAVGATHISE
ncbi:hypothetical protein K438DRAFT_1975813 [Mycena galopus ATCC 62051]|nr:hypothetical protein K438DRAFT_1975813 [Mycena galopus ATCC 62051]